MKYFLTILGFSSLLLLKCNNRDDTRFIFHDNNDSLIGYVGVSNPIDISKWTCNKTNDTLNVKSFSVIIYRPNGIMNMNDVIYNDGNYYQACMACSYEEGLLTNIYLYGTEGKYKIEKDELDSIYKNVPEKRHISINNSKIYDLTKKKDIFKNKKDSFFCFDNDSLYLYNIRKR